MLKRFALLYREGGRLKIEDLKTFEDNLENLYTALKCDCIDIQQRAIGGRIVDFVFDDEYLLKPIENELPTAIFDGEGEEAIFGRLIIAGTADDEGNLTDLCDLDFEAIRKAITPYRAIGKPDEPNLNPIFFALRYTI